MRIHITGASGSGTTTLGRELARQLGFVHLDGDDYYWLRTSPPFKEKRDPRSRSALLLQDLRSAPDAIVSGSMVGWGADIEDGFDLVVFLYLPAAIRVERLRARVLARFGAVDPAFLEWAGQYDEGPPEGRSLARHHAWLEARKCPVLRLEGDDPAADRVRRVLQALPVTLREETFSDIGGYATVPSRFEAASILDVVRHGDRYGLRERLLERPLRKDYDLLENPLDWPARFDTSNWILLGAYQGACRVGGAIGAARTAGVDMLEGRDDLAVLWDLRVSPDARRRGVGSSLFRAIEAWAARTGCRELKVETQNTNLAACRFYASQGCVLAGVHPGAYPGLPDEAQLFWRKAVRA